MKTTHATTIVRWYKTICELQLQIPHLLKSVTRPVIKSSKPRPLSGMVSKSEVPRAIPDFNPSAKVRDPHYCEVLRATLCSMQGSLGSKYSSMTSDDLLVILDSGCSIAITPDITDFKNGKVYPCQATELKGIASGLKIEGIGVVEWKFTDDQGEKVTVSLQCLYVPDASIRLLPPQQLALAEGAHPTNGSWFGGKSEAKVFYQGHCISFPFDSETNLTQAVMMSQKNLLDFGERSFCCGVDFHMFLCRILGDSRGSCVGTRAIRRKPTENFVLFTAGSHDLDG